MEEEGAMKEHFGGKRDKPYNDFSGYFRDLFDYRVQKISVDAGFSCPNRDGTKAWHGCAYCNNQTFSPEYCHKQQSISAQLAEGIQFFSRKYKTMKFLAYFQSYSNTYAQPDVLKRRYEEALGYPGVVGLVIGTRPDCVDAWILDYLAELAKDFYISLEYGVESVLDSTLLRINRGHTFAQSRWAITETSRRGIHCGAHLILGLPGETSEDWLNQSRVVSELPMETIKLHQLQIHRHTQFAAEYAKRPEEFHLFTLEEYQDLLVDYLELLNPRIVVERFISQAPDNLLIAPRWGLKNYEFTARLEKRMRAGNSWQGKRFDNI